jgi:hypothetical protein
MSSSQVYRIRDRRAIPVVLPDSKTHPKGKLLEGLDASANPGSEVTLAKDGTILRHAWGYVPDGNVDYSKHGLEGFDGEILFSYRFDRQGRIQLHEITVPDTP